MPGLGNRRSIQISKNCLQRQKKIPYEKRSTNALDYNAKNSTVLKEHEKWTNGYVNGAGPVDPKTTH